MLGRLLRIASLGAVLAGCQDRKNEPFKWTTGEVLRTGGPFGTVMGMNQKAFFPDSESARLSRLSDGSYLTTSVPRPFAAFEYYNVEFSSVGLCAISGTAVRATGHDPLSEYPLYDSIMTALKEKYGKPTDLPVDSMSNGPLPTVWRSSSEHELPNGLESVSFEIAPSRSSSGEALSFRVRYQFVNYPLCDRERKEGWKAPL